MSQLREMIRKMVRNEFAARIVAEAEGEEAKKGEKIYRHSNYVAAWSDLPPGKMSGEPSNEASKSDFVRWFMAQYVKPNSSLRLDNRYNAVRALLEPLQDNTDKFVEALNKDRELVFGSSNYRSATDPVSAILDVYLKFKEMRGHLSKTTAFDHVKVDSGSEDGEEAGKTYDVDPNLTSKADIAKMLGADPTETTTEQSVGNKVESALKHLGVDKVKDLLRLYKSNDSSTEEKAEIKANLTKLGKLVTKAVDSYAYKFTESMIDGFDGVDENDEESLQRAFANGLVAFKESLGVRMGSQEIDVFNEVMEETVSRDKTVLDLVIAAAQNADNADLYFDEILAAARPVFIREYNRQSNFNSLGDYIDGMPEVKAVRTALETIARRGRPAGSTKEAMAARLNTESRKR